MKFEFDTRTDTAKDAAALAAALAVLHGDEVAKVLDAAATRIEADPRAVDGYPAGGAREADEAYAAEVAAKRAATVSNIPAIGERALLVDTAGLPWDERIHASTKTTNKDGTWSRRRNTPDATFDTVMAELVAARDGAPQEPNAAEAFGNPTPSEAPAPPATDGSKAPGDTQDSGDQTSSTGQTAPTAASPSSPVPPPPPAPAASADPITFPKLMVKITKAQTAKTIDPAKVLEFLGMFGLSAVKELASAPAETIQAVNDLVDAHVGA